MSEIQANMSMDGVTDNVAVGLMALPGGGEAEEAVEGIIAAGDMAEGANGTADSVSRLNLQKSLASEAQMGEDGTVIAGGDSGKAFRDAPRVVSEWGGSSADWVKMKSSSFTTFDAFQFRTHWIENLETGQRIEYKTKLWSECPL